MVGQAIAVAGSMSLLAPSLPGRAPAGRGSCVQVGAGFLGESSGVSFTPVLGARPRKAALWV